MQDIYSHHYLNTKSSLFYGLLDIHKKWLLQAVENSFASKITNFMKTGLYMIFKGFVLGPEQFFDQKPSIAMKTFYFDGN